VISWFEAVVLGVVQGLTEFLPISSSGHLRVVPALAGWADPGAAFTAVVQLGTMAAVLLYFARDLGRIAGAWLRSLVNPSLRGSLDTRMGWYIILGTIPIAVLGLAFSHSIEDSARDLRLIGWSLILFGIVLFVADRVSAQDKGIGDLGLRDGLLYGLAQALALIPGVSRSGATITAGRLMRYDRASAARFSFLLSIPAVVLSGLYEARKVGEGQGPEWGPTILATVVAFVVGYASIAWLLRYLTRHSMLVFAVYRVVVGAGVLGLVYGGAVAAR
jgi:undecaprenyl-diphosphatase